MTRLIRVFPNRRIAFSLKTEISKWHDRSKPTRQPKKTAVKLPEIKLRGFRVWIVGDTPLITHAWSEKAKRQMLDKQLKNANEGRPVRDPDKDFVNSLYEFDDEGHYGFPAMAVKKAMLSAAHKDKGVPMTTVRGALWLHAEMVRTRPAKAGAICDMPLLRIYGSEPEMREDMVKIGSGLSKTADLAYRGQFTTWALRIAGRLNVSVCPLELDSVLDPAFRAVDRHRRLAQ